MLTKASDIMTAWTALSDRGELTEDVISEYLTSLTTDPDELLEMLDASDLVVSQEPTSPTLTLTPEAVAAIEQGRRAPVSAVASSRRGEVASNALRQRSLVETIETGLVTTIRPADLTHEQWNAIRDAFSRDPGRWTLRSVSPKGTQRLVVLESESGASVLVTVGLDGRIEGRTDI